MAIGDELKKQDTRFRGWMKRNWKFGLGVVCGIALVVLGEALGVIFK
jgi:hypothetical protein